MMPDIPDGILGLPQNLLAARRPFRSRRLFLLLPSAPLPYSSPLWPAQPLAADPTCLPDHPTRRFLRPPRGLPDLPTTPRPSEGLPDLPATFLTFRRPPSRPEDLLGVPEDSSGGLKD